MIDENNWLVEKWLEECLLPSEGGYVNHINDRGGETNLGITRSTFNKAKQDNLIKPQLTTVRNLTKEQALQIYTIYYVRPVIQKLEKFPPKSLSPSTVIHMLDIAINSGPYMAFRLLSRDKSPNHTNRQEITNIRIAFYHGIVYSNRSQRVFLKGWLNRVSKLNKWLDTNGQTV